MDNDQISVQDPLSDEFYHVRNYRRPTFKCEDAINVNANFPPRFAIIRTKLKYWYYVCGDESRQAQNAVIELAISFKTQTFYYAFKCGPTVY